MVRASLPLAVILAVTPVCAVLHAQMQPQNEAVVSALAAHAYDLKSDGRAFLLSQARTADYFMLGELHGDNEIPLLIREIWPEMSKYGYRHVAAEVSPWTAHLLETEHLPAGTRIEGLWTKQQAKDLQSIPGSGASIIWGCDMEEIHPEYLIREMARLNPDNSSLRQMASLTKEGYQRSMAARLLSLARADTQARDERVNDISLRKNLIATLEIDAHRAVPASKMTAQTERELLMKTQFLAHIQATSNSHRPSRVLLRFGRNHLHRGYDARGISTLGNFVAEYAISRGQSAFNVGAFGAGGNATLMGETFSMDETGDELAFAFLASKAPYDATVFDLRPLRPLLHAIPQDKRTPLETNLIYWSDAYDALICYKNVTPLVGSK